MIVKFKHDIAKLRINIATAPLLDAIESNSNSNTKPKKIVTKPSTGEAMWIVPMSDNRVGVHFAIKWRDQDEACLGNTFLKELVDTRALPNNQNAPIVGYSDNVPVDLVGEDVLPGATYISIGIVPLCVILIHSHTQIPVLFERNVAVEKRQAAMERILTFPEYLQAHIRSAKIYLHSRMRIKTDEMQSAIKGMSLRREPEKTFRYHIYLVRMALT